MRRYITDGILQANGETLRLKGRQVSTGRGPEWQIYQSDLDEFKTLRDRSSTEGHETSQAVRSADESQVLMASMHLLSVERERRIQEGAQAQATIERLALEIEQQLERGKIFEGELTALRRHIATLEQECHQLLRQQPRRIRPLPLQEKPSHFPAEKKERFVQDFAQSNALIK